MADNKDISFDQILSEDDNFKNFFNDDAKDDVKDEVTPKENTTKDDVKDEVKDDITPKDNTKDDPVKTTSRSVWDHLVNQKIISPEDENLKGDDLDIQSEIERAGVRKVSEQYENLPPVVKGLIEYSKNNGDPDKYIEQYYKNIALNKEININDEDSQRRLVINDYQKRGIEREDAESLVDGWNTNKLKETAQTIQNKYKIENETKLQEENDAKAKYAEETERNEKEIRRNVRKAIAENKKIGSTPLSPDDRRTFENYVFDKNVDLGENKFTTQFNNDIGKIYNNLNTFIEFALMVKNINPDGSFNFDKIKKELQSSQTRKIKKTLEPESKNNNMKDFFE